jgi:hypothetical protein
MFELSQQIVDLFAIQTAQGVILFPDAETDPTDYRSKPAKAGTPSPMKLRLQPVCTVFRGEMFISVITGFFGNKREGRLVLHNNESSNKWSEWTTTNE